MRAVLPAIWRLPSEPRSSFRKLHGCSDPPGTNVAMPLDISVAFLVALYGPRSRKRWSAPYLGVADEAQLLPTRTLEAKLSHRGFIQYVTCVIFVSSPLRLDSVRWFSLNTGSGRNDPLAPLSVRRVVCISPASRPELLLIVNVFCMRRLVCFCDSPWSLTQTVGREVLNFFLAHPTKCPVP
jgi:hypothetical protein